MIREIKLGKHSQNYKDIVEQKDNENNRKLSVIAPSIKECNRWLEFLN